jgi:hypothetical protein
MRPARFIIFDGRAALFVVFVLLRLVSLYTWGIFLSALLFFYILERFGLSFEAALRRFRSAICGKKRPAYIWTAKRRMLDLSSGR